MRYLLLTSSLMLAALLDACGPKHADDSPYPPFSYSLPTELLQKGQSYRNLVSSVQDKWGFVSSENCDALIMTSLLGASGVPVADIYAAEDPTNPGKWVRRPQFRDGAPLPCYGNKDPELDSSRSSISRDQLLGLAWYFWRTKDLAGAQRVRAYADAHGNTMGEGDEATTGLRLPLSQTYSLLIEKLGGPAHVGVIAPLPDVAPLSGYQQHLQALHILLRGEIQGDISALQRWILCSLADKHPDSPLMQAAAAHWYSSTYWPKFLSAAMNERYFPTNRLPTSADRCTDWAVQQDNPADWVPCPKEQKTHSGGDFLFAVSILSDDRT